MTDPAAHHRGHHETDDGERHAEHGAHPGHDAHAGHHEDEARGHESHTGNEEHGPSGHSGHDAHVDHGGHADHEGHAGHDAHAGHHGHGDHVAQFRRLFWINLVLAVPVIAFSSMFAMLVGYSVPTWAVWIAPVLGTVMYAWGGRPFLTGAVSEIKSRTPGMMLLIGLAITVAFLASWAATLGLASHELEFWWELALLIVIMLLGHWVEMRSLARTTSALDSLAALLPDEAERVEGDDVVTVPPADLRVGDVVLVRPGGSVPADGTIVEGRADMDESMITGESRTVSRGVGEDVTAGTVATDSGLRVEITATGEDTTLAGINRLVAQAQSWLRAQRLADRAAALLFWFALGAAIVTAIVWSVLGQPDAAVVRSITVLVIACPHALGLAIPLVVAIATERAARGGVLVKDRLALESMRQVHTVLFDKTGTLTMGEPSVVDVVGSDDVDDEEVLALAAAAEADSEHPLARAIVSAAKARGVRVERAGGFSSSPAVGVTATVAGREIRVGGPRLLEETGQGEVAQAEGWRSEGAIILHVLRDGAVVGGLKLADEVRPESREAVDGLHALGVQVVMITGDAQAVADAVGGKLGIDRVFAGVRPEDKAATVARLQEEELGSRWSATASTTPRHSRRPMSASRSVLAPTSRSPRPASFSRSSDPRSVLSVIELSRAAYRKMKQNLWWAAGYNLIAVPLAAGVLAPIGFVMPMSVGAVLMSLSTIVVALNAQLLRRLDLSPEASARAVLARAA